MQVEIFFPWKCKFWKALFWRRKKKPFNSRQIFDDQHNHKFRLFLKKYQNCLEFPLLYSLMTSPASLTLRRGTLIACPSNRPKFTLHVSPASLILLAVPGRYLSRLYDGCCIGGTLCMTAIVNVNSHSTFHTANWGIASSLPSGYGDVRI
jgi:hypothetical protein